MGPEMTWLEPGACSQAPSQLTLGDKPGAKPLCVLCLLMASWEPKACLRLSFLCPFLSLLLLPSLPFFPSSSVFPSFLKAHGRGQTGGKDGKTKEAEEGRQGEVSVRTQLSDAQRVLANLWAVVTFSFPQPHPPKVA